MDCISAFLVFFYPVSALTEWTYLINKPLNACLHSMLTLSASRLDLPKTEKMHLPPRSTLAFVQHMSLLGLITSSQHSTHPRFLFSQLKSTGLSPFFFFFFFFFFFTLWALWACLTEWLILANFTLQTQVQGLKTQICQSVVALLKTELSSECPTGG